MPFLSIVGAAALTLVLLLAAGTGISALLSRSVLRETGPDTLGDTDSLAQLLAAGEPLHLIYVHGMRAMKPGASKQIVALLESRLGYAATPEPDPIYIPVGPRPADATYAGQTIWTDDAAWDASRPFLMRTRLDRPGGPQIVVDELNWWPLLFPLKGRFLLVPEHDLSGDDRKNLARIQDPTPPFHDWLTGEEKRILARPSKAMRAARLNRTLKQQIMNWGLADAVIALGPMQQYIHRAVEGAFALSRKAAAGDRFVVMTESLGSFAVLDTMRDPGAEAVQEVMRRTSHLYLFANQFALLELARLGGMAGSGATKSLGADDTPSPLELLRDWASQPHKLAQGGATRELPKQVIAFSDPSDVLTYRVPPIPGAKVVNILDRNGPTWLFLAVDPVRAHTGHLDNKAVWRVLTRS